jgi:hypothetical protein
MRPPESVVVVPEQIIPTRHFEGDEESARIIDANGLQPAYPRVAGLSAVSAAVERELSSEQT